MILSDLWEILKCPLRVWEREGMVQKKIFEETTPENFQNLLCVLVAQLCMILCVPMDCSPRGSFVHGIFQAIILEWVAISFCRRSSQPRDQTSVSHIAGRLFITWATREAPKFGRKVINLSKKLSKFLTRTKKTTLSHIIVILLETKDKEEI